MMFPSGKFSATRIRSHRHTIDHFRSVRRIEQLEDHYGRAISGKTPSFEEMSGVLRDCEKIFHELSALIDSLNLKSQPPDYGMGAVWASYRSEIRALHESNRLWLTLFLDLFRPEDSLPFPKKKAANNEKESARPAAEKLWSDLEDCFSPRETRVRAILNTKKARDSHPVNSSLWRRAHRELSSKLSDFLVATLHENQRRIRRCYKKIIYSQVTRDMGREAEQDRIADWVAGYKEGGEKEKGLEARAAQSLWPHIRQSENEQWRRSAVKRLTLALIVAMTGLVLHNTELDTRIWDTVVTGVKKILSIDPASLMARHKNNYFYNQILAIDQDYHAKDILEQVRHFETARLHESREGYFYFADKVLKGFFLLLSDGDADAGLKSAVLSAAGLLGGDVQSSLTTLVELFEKDTMRESALRAEMLNLRRAFVSRDVFPFMFLVIRQERPYLFLFPETIDSRFEFGGSDFEKLGLNFSYYSHHVKFPLEAYVVKGRQYPFKDRAGYFEGEYAIVFSDLAPKVEWTAWHELGHVVDDLRFKYGGRTVQPNVEVNAVLFPVIFADDAKDYVFNRLLPIIESGEIRDYYVQAVKGIWNGLAILKSERAGRPFALITDKLEKNHIEMISAMIRSLDRGELGEMALAVYLDQQKYLATAGTGQYRGVISNAEEVIAGTHGAPQGGFVLTNYGWGGFLGGGPKFIRDVGEVEDAAGGWAAFLSRVFAAMFSWAGAAPQVNSVEALVAAILSFVLIEVFFVAIHHGAAPYRIRRFHGRSLKELINGIYDRHPWSSGLSRGGELGARPLLLAVLNSGGKITEELKAQVRAFKATVGEHERSLFDVALTLAPFNPARSAITHKAHHFLFWVPFLGPWIARHPFVFARQAVFKAREDFNQRIVDLACGVTAGTPVEIFKKDFLKIMADYRSRSLPSMPDDKFLNNLGQIEQRVFHGLNEQKRGDRLPRPLIRHRVPVLAGQDGDFDRLDAYAPGDDIKRIDWKATARSSHNEPKVRRYASSSGARVGLLLDLRHAGQRHAQEKIAWDFVRSLRVMGQDSRFKRLIVIMPGGAVDTAVFSMAMTGMVYQDAERIWAAVEGACRRYETHAGESMISGLSFYTDEENARYQSAVALTDFNQPALEDQRLDQIFVNNLNIFMIGVTMGNRQILEQSLPKNNQYYYWT